MFNVFQTETALFNFHYVKTLCVASANGQFKCLIKQVKDYRSLFILLADNKLHCNWLRLKIFEAISIATGSKRLENTLKEYKKTVFSKTLHEIWDCLPHGNPVRNNYYEKLTITFKDKPENVTVEKLKEHCTSPLTNDLDDFIIDIHHNCVTITWLIPTDKAYQFFLSALTVPQESREDDFLQIGVWEVYQPQFVLQKLRTYFG